MSHFSVESNNRKTVTVPNLSENFTGHFTMMSIQHIKKNILLDYKDIAKYDILVNFLFHYS